MEVIKADDGFQPVNSNPDIQRKVIHLNDLMVTIIDFHNGPMEVPDPFHHHPHEQITYVVTGSLLFFIEDRQHTLHAGDSFKVASNLKHSIQTLTEHVRLIDSFSPIREEFL
ncbi:cupin domain-containing protein [Mangrovimonas sp. DI 80]|uniref:cupin domain-containing protein n=1 Tax=Mangrovimonas sp. DI 80 TaxID=1779330 RepID=UPI000978B2C4|nr:cupin domain-containing protein [Mangrovimonas sp. DI 80]OMP30323.1 hypothetical protein BKM32_13145 [Mangrovimonas sp. DI 80]